MSRNIQMEAQLLVLSVVTGAGLMAAYDVLRILRLIIPHRAVVVGIEDALYWCGAAFVTFYLLYRENDGALRMYVIGTVLLAMVVYDRLCSAFLLKLLKNVGKWIKLILLRIRCR